MQIFGPPNVKKMLASKNYPGIVNALNYKKDAEVRISAVKALPQTLWDRQVDYDMVVAALEKVALSDVDNRVCLAATVAIPEIGGNGYSQVESLVRILKGTQDLQLQKTTIDALVRCLEKNPDSRPDTIGHALAPMGALAIESLITRLQLFRQHPDYPGAELKAIGGTLVKMGELAVSPLIAALEKHLPEANTTVAINALGQIGGLQATEKLVGLLENRWTKRAAALALGQLRDPRAVEFLMTMLSTGDGRQETSIDTIRAAKALARIKDPRAIEKLVIVATEAFDRNVRAATQEAVVQFGDPKAVQLLVAWHEGYKETYEEYIPELKMFLAKVLTSCEDSISLEDLRAVARLKDNHRAVARSRRDRADETTHYSDYVTVDYSSLRSQAQRMLERRGIIIDH